jgi:protein-tyrosine phosphatase
MFGLITIAMAIATLGALGYVGFRVLLFGLVKPEDVESNLRVARSQLPDEKVFVKRKPVARSVASKLGAKLPSLQSPVRSHSPTTQTFGALACQNSPTVIPTIDCDRVTSSLLIGSYPLDSKEIEELRSVGITAILCLQTDEDLGERGIEWERNATVTANLTFQSVPVRDFDAADLQQKLPNCVVLLDRMLKAGHTVYLHCTAGVNRSPTVAAAYLHSCLAWPLERALAHLREVRDCCPNAEAIQGARWPWRGVWDRDWECE